MPEKTRFYKEKIDDRVKECDGNPVYFSRVKTSGRFYPFFL